MDIIWKGSPNYWAGRTQKVTKLLQHWSVGDLASTDRQFATSASEVSAHYGIEDAKLHGYVRDEDTAWHARQANPFAIGIEHSAGPNRPASDKTYETSIQLNAALCRKFGLNPDDAIEYHKKYVATQCSELDLERIKAGVRALLKGAPVPAPVLVSKPSLPQPTANTRTTGTVTLPQSATRWRVYPVNKTPTVGNESGYLNPSLQQGGLVYEILANPTANVYTIQTRDFGKVNIYAGAETGAFVAISSGQGITKGSGASKTVYLPAVPAWRVYRTGGPYTIGNEIGYLAPVRWNGLAYAVLSQPQANVVVVETGAFGRVALYVGSETGAVVK